MKVKNPKFKLFCVINMFIMYYISGPSLLVESVDSTCMITWITVYTCVRAYPPTSHVDTGYCKSATFVLHAVLVHTHIRV